jgi:hypothetical protein
VCFRVGCICCLVKEMHIGYFFLELFQLVKLSLKAKRRI